MGASQATAHHPSLSQLSTASAEHNACRHTAAGGVMHSCPSAQGARSTPTPRDSSKWAPSHHAPTRCGETCRCLPQPSPRPASWAWDSCGRKSRPHMAPAEPLSCTRSTPLAAHGPLLCSVPGPPGLHVSGLGPMRSGAPRRTVLAGAPSCPRNRGPLSAPACRERDPWRRDGRKGGGRNRSLCAE